MAGTASVLQYIGPLQIFLTSPMNRNPFRKVGNFVPTETELCNTNMRCCKKYWLLKCILCDKRCGETVSRHLWRCWLPHHNWSRRWLHSFRRLRLSDYSTGRLYYLFGQHCRIRSLVFQFILFEQLLRSDVPWIQRQVSDSFDIILQWVAERVIQMHQQLVVGVDLAERQIQQRCRFNDPGPFRTNLWSKVKIIDMAQILLRYVLF